MAVYEKKLTRIQRIITRTFEILEPLMNSKLNRTVITLFMRNMKLGKVTKYLENLDISLENLG